MVFIAMIWKGIVKIENGMLLPEVNRLKIFQMLKAIFL
jgi:hypothetical protein